MVFQAPHLEKAGIPQSCDRTSSHPVSCSPDRQLRAVGKPGKGLMSTIVRSRSARRHSQGGGRRWGFVMMADDVLTSLVLGVIALVFFRFDLGLSRES